MFFFATVCLFVTGVATECTAEMVKIFDNGYCDLGAPDAAAGNLPAIRHYSSRGEVHNFCSNSVCLGADGCVGYHYRSVYIEALVGIWEVICQYFMLPGTVLPGMDDPTLAILIPLRNEDSTLIPSYTAGVAWTDREGHESSGGCWKKVYSSACNDPDFMPLFGRPDQTFHVVLKNLTGLYHVVSDCDLLITGQIFSSLNDRGQYLNQWFTAFYFQFNQTKVIVEHGRVVVNGRAVLPGADHPTVVVHHNHVRVLIPQLGQEWSVNIREVSAALQAKAATVLTAVGKVDAIEWDWNRLDLSLTTGSKTSFSKHASGLLGYSTQFDNLDLVDKWFPGQAEDFLTSSPFANPTKC